LPAINRSSKRVATKEDINITVRRNSLKIELSKSFKSNRDVSVDKNQHTNFHNSCPVNNMKEKLLSVQVQEKESVNKMSSITNTPVSIFKSPNSQIHIPLKVDYLSLNLVSPKNIFKGDFSTLSSSIMCSINGNKSKRSMPKGAIK
jgi:hypothetical protein